MHFDLQSNHVCKCGPERGKRALYETILNNNILFQRLYIISEIPAYRKWTRMKYVGAFGKFFHISRNQIGSYVR